MGKRRFLSFGLCFILTLSMIIGNVTPALAADYEVSLEEKQGDARAAEDQADQAQAAAQAAADAAQDAIDAANSKVVDDAEKVAAKEKQDAADAKKAAEDADKAEKNAIKEDGTYNPNLTQAEIDAVNNNAGTAAAQEATEASDDAVENKLDAQEAAKLAALAAQAAKDATTQQAAKDAAATAQAAAAAAKSAANEAVEDAADAKDALDKANEVYEDAQKLVKELEQDAKVADAAAASAVADDKAAAEAKEAYEAALKALTAAQTAYTDASTAAAEAKDAADLADDAAEKALNEAVGTEQENADTADNENDAAIAALKKAKEKEKAAKEAYESAGKWSKAAKLLQYELAIASRKAAENELDRTSNLLEYTNDELEYATDIVTDKQQANYEADKSANAENLVNKYIEDYGWLWEIKLIEHYGWKNAHKILDSADEADFKEAVSDAANAVDRANNAAASADEEVQKAIKAKAAAAKDVEDKLKALGALERTAKAAQAKADASNAESKKLAAEAAQKALLEAQVDLASAKLSYQTACQEYSEANEAAILAQNAADEAAKSAKQANAYKEATRVYYYVLNRGLAQPVENGSTQYSNSNYSKGIEGTIKILQLINNNDDAVYANLDSIPTDFSKVGVNLKDGEYIKWYVIKKTDNSWHVDGFIMNQKYNLTINYRTIENDEIVNTTSITQEVILGSNYSVDTPALYGYTPSISVVSGVMPGQDVIVNVDYTKEETLPVTAHFYKDSLENEEFEPVTINVPVSVFDSEDNGLGKVLELLDSQIKGNQPAYYNEGTVAFYGEGVIRILYTEKLQAVKAYFYKDSVENEPFDLMEINVPESAFNTEDNGQAYVVEQLGGLDSKKPESYLSGTVESYGDYVIRILYKAIPVVTPTPTPVIPPVVTPTPTPVTPPVVTPTPTPVTPPVTTPTPTPIIISDNTTPAAPVTSPTITPTTAPTLAPAVEEINDDLTPGGAVSEDTNNGGDQQETTNIADNATPKGGLPQTGTTPIELYYGLGLVLSVAGFAILRFKKTKKAE